MTICIRVETSENMSLITGRNGCFRIDQVQIMMAKRGHTHVFIDARSCNTGKLINGGLIIEPEAMDKLATEWLEARKEADASR